MLVDVCNDIKLHCPDEHCDTVHPRDCIKQHATKDCQDYLVNCAGADCEKKVKRENKVSTRWIYSSHIEHDSGAVIELGRREWLKHEAEDCPNAGANCYLRLLRAHLGQGHRAGRNAHICSSGLDKTSDLLSRRILPTLPPQSCASPPPPSMLSIEDIPAASQLPQHISARTRPIPGRSLKSIVPTSGTLCSTSWICTLICLTASSISQPKCSICRTTWQTSTPGLAWWS
jgi:hypothetical protein